MNLRLLKMIFATIGSLNQVFIYFKVGFRYFFPTNKRFRRVLFLIFGIWYLFFALPEPIFTAPISVVLEDKKAVHYYSNYNEKLDDYFQSREYDYENNYEFKTNSMCKINEICIMFLIFYNEQVSDKCYDLIYLDDKTLKVVMCLAVLKSNIEF